MFHSRDSPRLLVCDTELYLEQNDIGFITVEICGGYISKYPGLIRHDDVIKRKLFIASLLTQYDVATSF